MSKCINYVEDIIKEKGGMSPAFLKKLVNRITNSKSLDDLDKMKTSFIAELNDIFKDVNLQEVNFNNIDQYIKTIVEDITKEIANKTEYSEDYSEMVDKENSTGLSIGDKVEEFLLENIMDFRDSKLFAEVKIEYTNPVIGGIPVFPIIKLPSLISNKRDQLINEAVHAATLMGLNQQPGLPLFTDFVTSNADVNNNIVAIKAKWWADVLKSVGRERSRTNQLYVRSGDKWILNKDLFKINPSSNSSIYIDVLKKVQNNYANLKVNNVTKDSSTIAIYLKALLLANFDSLVVGKSSGKLSLNESARDTWNDPLDGDYKYFSRKLVSVNKTWAPDSSGENDASDYETSDFKVIANNIPYLKVSDGEKAKSVDAFLGTNAVNASGAVLNDLPRDLLISLVKDNKTTISKTIAQWHADIAKGEVSIRDFFTALIQDRNSHNNLDLIADYIYSIHEYLYSEDNGVITKRNKWPNKEQIFDFEGLIYNQFRNSAKGVYVFSEIKTGKKTRTVDVLLLDSVIKDDFELLFSGFSQAWINSKDKLLAHPFWNINTGGFASQFVDLLNKFTDLDISSTAFKKYIKDLKFGTKVKEKIENGEVIVDVKFFPETIKKLKEILSENTKYSITDEFENVRNYAIDAEALEEDFRDPKSHLSSVDIVGLFKNKHRAEFSNVITQISKTGGEKIPTLVIGNLSLLMNEAILEFTENTSNISHREFLKNFNGFINKLEVTTSEGSKDFAELSAKDNMALEIVQLFFGKMATDETVLIQPWNYADKSKILTAVFSVKNVIEKSNTIEEKIKEEKEKYIKLQKEYLSTVKEELITTYSKLYGVANISLKEISKRLLKETTYSLFNKVLEYNSKNADKLNVTEELHYSSSGKNLILNPLLEHQISIWVDGTNKEQEIEFEKIEENFAKDLEEMGIDLDVTIAGISKNRAVYSNAGTISRKLLKLLHGSKSEPALEIHTYKDEKTGVSVEKEVENDDILTEYFNIKYNTNEAGVPYLERDSKRRQIKESSIRVRGKDNKLSNLLKLYLTMRNTQTQALTNATFKGAYLHPAKGKAETIEDQESLRTLSYFKRMVGPGASMQRFLLGDNYLPQEVKIACMENPTNQVYTINGEVETQKSFDGAVLIPPFALQFFLDSLPGGDVTRVMKPIGVSMSQNNAMFLKCAFFGVTNEMILASPTHGERNLMQFVEKTSNEPFPDSEVLVREKNITIWENFPGSTDLFVLNNGVYTTIKNIFYNPEDKTYEIIYRNGSFKKGVKIDSAYDLWNVLGGALSKSRNSEGQLVYSNISSELVSKILKYQASKGKTEYRDSLIFLVVPREGIKNGITNINPADVFSTNSEKPERKLLTTSYKLDLTGIQLNASYDADSATISEVTQLLSALAENNNNPKKSLEIYEGIERIIDKSLEDFGETGELNSTQKKEIYNSFINSLERATLNKDAYSFVEDLKEQLSTTNGMIPFSDRVFFKQFISNIITKINHDFIRNRVAGAGMVLEPSSGMIQIYRDVKGKTYLGTDLLNRYNEMLINALKNPNNNVSFLQFHKNLISQNKWPTELISSQIKYILENDKDFAKVTISDINDVNPMDIVEVTDEHGKVIYNLTEITKYYEFIKKFKGSKISIQKLNNAPSDLKPETFTFEYVDLTHLQKFLAEVDLDTIEKDIKIENYLKETASYKTVLSIVNTHFGEKVTDDVVSNIVNAYINLSLKKRNIYNTTHTVELFKLMEIKKKATISAIKKNPYGNSFYRYLKTNNSHFKKIVDSNNEEDIITSYYIYISKFQNLYYKTLHNGYIFNEYDGNEDYFNNILTLRDNTIDTLEYSYNTTEYKNISAVFNTKYTPAEKISSKIHRDSFGIAGNSMGEISPEFFKNKISRSFRKIKSKRFDVILMNPVKPNKVVKLINETLYTEDTFKEIKDTLSYAYVLKNNGDLVFWTKSGVENKVGTSAYVNRETNRRSPANNHGEGYKVSKDLHVFIDLHGQDLIVSDDSDLLVSFINDNNTYFGLINLNNKVKTNFLEKLNSGLSNWSHKDFVSNALRISNLTQEELDKEITRINKGYINDKADLLKNSFSKYIWKEASKIYRSYELSRDSVDSRIPAQGGQSFMSMKTVGYLHENANTVYVSIWQLFLQGSDFDIDKLFVSTYTINNGYFAQWSPFFRLDTDKELKKSLTLSLPLGKDKVIPYKRDDIPLSSIVSKVEKIEGENSFLVLDMRSLNTKVVDGKVKNFDDIVDIINIFKDNYEEGMQVIADPAILDILTKHNKFYNLDGFNNFKVYNMIQVSSSLINRPISNSPVTFGDYRTKVKSSIRKPKLSLSNPATIYIQQENNFIGKGVIGIAANGMKDYFSLITYFSQYYNKGKFSVNDNQTFLREYNIGKGSKKISKIAGIQLKKIIADKIKSNFSTRFSEGSLLKKEDGTFYSQEELVSFVDEISFSDTEENIALKLSSILSAATDNAKELILADINAGIDFANMHVYLIILGFNEIDVAKYMTSEIVLEIKKELSNSFIKPKYRSSPENRLFEIKADKHIKTKLLRELQAAEKIDQEAINEEITNINRIIKEFKEIYVHASELKNLGKGLSLNQGIKGKVNDLYLVARQVSLTVQAQQEKFIKLNVNSELSWFDKLSETYKSIDIFQSLDKSVQERIFANIRSNKELTNVINSFDDLILKSEEIKKVINNSITDKLIEAVMKDKPYLELEYVKEVLILAAENELITGGINHRKYFENDLYKKNVIDYYNLIKFSFNVLDVIDYLPHFKAMTKSFKSGNAYLEQDLLGYRLISDYMPNLVDVAILGQEITTYNSLRSVKYKGKKGGNTLLTDTVLEKTQDLLFEEMLRTFLENQTSYVWDFTSFIKNTYGKENTIITNNKLEVKEVTVTLDEKKYDFNPNSVDASNAFVVDLTTDYGMAKFKYIMDYYVIPHFKKSKNNEFLKNYTYKKGIGYNFRITKKAYESVQRADWALNVEIHLEKLSKNLNNEYSINILKNLNEEGIPSENIETVKLFDLLYLYDRVQNLKRYGGNRTTSFFDKYFEDSPLGIDLIKHQSKFEESPEEFLDNLVSRSLANSNDSEESKNRKKAYREVLYLSLFGYSSKNGRVYQFKDPSKNMEDDVRENLNKGIFNEYFRINRSLETITMEELKQNVKKKKIERLQKKISENNAIINIKCK